MNTTATTTKRVEHVTDWETPDVETSSEAYAQRFSGAAGAWMLAVQQTAVLKLLSRYPRASILEVGGGHGQLTGALLRQGHSITILGSDASCQRRVRSFVDEGRCRFMTGNLTALPCPTQSFDVVVSVRLLPHLENWRRAAAEMTRVARKAVIVDFPISRSLNCLTPALFGVKKKLEGDTRAYRLFKEQEVAQAFAQQGWHLQGRVAEFFWPMVLHRMLKTPALSSGLEGLARFAGLTRHFGSPIVALWSRNGKR